MLEPEIVMEKDPPTVPGAGKRGHLLVVEDDEAIQKILSKILSFMGYVISVTTSFTRMCQDIVYLNAVLCQDIVYPFGRCSL
jgi:DNA-binding NtrC family response regulator